MFSTVSPFAVAVLTVAIALSSSVDAFTPSTTFVRTHKVNGCCALFYIHQKSLIMSRWLTISSHTHLFGSLFVLIDRLA